MQKWQNMHKTWLLVRICYFTYNQCLIIAYFILLLVLRFCLYPTAHILWHSHILLLSVSLYIVLPLLLFSSVLWLRITLNFVQYILVLIYFTSFYLLHLIIIDLHAYLLIYLFIDVMVSCVFGRLVRYLDRSLPILVVLPSIANFARSHIALAMLILHSLLILIPV
jgi:hypothetical protein